MYMTGYVLHILRTDDFVRQAEKTVWRIGLIRNGEGAIAVCIETPLVLSRTLQNKPFAIMLSWASPLSGRAVNGGAQVPPLLAELI
jgi:hypothetical protein